MAVTMTPLSGCPPEVDVTFPEITPDTTRARLTLFVSTPLVTLTPLMVFERYPAGDIAATLYVPEARLEIIL